MHEGHDVILGIERLGTPWKTPDPFLFCMFHEDAYPAGNDRLGPAASLAGRELGEDFSREDGWSMYHGRVVPGFPQHPHRGFETVTFVRRGLVDHADSLGAVARYGHGDVQWLTAGRGINHAEMFPLLDRERPNPLELFQIWLNLPRTEKLAEPHFSMFWAHQVPRHKHRDEAGKETVVTVVAGAVGGARPPAPPPHSWAARPDADVAIWSVRMEPGATWTLPAAAPRSNRRLYFFRGTGLAIGGRAIPAAHHVDLRADAAVRLEAGADEVELLVLQGRPIGEPVFQYGPFVMNTREEVVQTIHEYQRTGFGGWPWDDDAPVHPREEGRLARYPDGSVLRPDSKAEDAGRP